MEETSPDYKMIFTDIITKQFPHKKELCQNILGKEKLSTFDIIKLNKLLFEKENKEKNTFNQKHRSYDTSTIQEILDYQIKNNLNNTELANYFMLSRNSVTKWKKMFNMNQKDKMT
ncbi:helix-turn-helix domain-containing protein [Chryseobacterium jejuense]|uniref:helix-turn-helix domain-containing protein n=1 Tax=Chryseobacterium jejuense TaxID=445960 RepID=UPI001AE4992F|nr:helix-turn-helix domain-containing protein [Chryseobacterium jejuense]MBP2619487.1 hypothetical protein [Chryseobacterium jejuense]